MDTREVVPRFESERQALALSVTSGSALAYVSVLDGRGGQGTSDPTTILPVSGGSSQVTLLELGSIQGLKIRRRGRPRRRSRFCGQ